MANILFVKNLSKEYKLYNTLNKIPKQIIIDFFKKFLKLKFLKDVYSTRVVLKNISFTLKKNETLGIIGKNGSGKSTLLKIISGVLTHSSGSLKVKGKISSILELGTAFNYELTAYENIEIYGSLMGISKNNFENFKREIISFADITEYLNQPLNTYSTGMIMRLAFSIQISIKPNLLIIDEALSVGDISFQEKCFRKINSLKKNGTSIIFVSHSIDQIRQICDRVILLDKGEMVLIDTPNLVLNRYEKLLQNRNIDTKKDFNKINKDIVQSNSTNFDRHRYLEIKNFRKKAIEDHNFGNNKASILNVVLTDEKNNPQKDFLYNQRCHCLIFVKANEKLNNIISSYQIRTLTGEQIIYADNHLVNMKYNSFNKDQNFTIVWKFNMNLSHGNYVFSTKLSKVTPLTGIRRKWETYDKVNTAYIFSVGVRSEGLIDNFTTWENKLEII